MGAQPDVLGDLLVLVELTSARERVPAGALERWALDCAGRSLGADLRGLDPHRSMLRAALVGARAALRERAAGLAPTTLADAHGRALAVREALDDTELDDLDTARSRAAAASVHHALRCIGEGLAPNPRRNVEAHATAERARAAFANGYAESLPQARRLLWRAQLLPTGAELLVRLDYAESRGALPPDPRAREWIHAQRRLLMAEDEDSRFALVLRHPRPVFLTEFEELR